MRLSCTSTMVPGKSLTEKARNLSRWGYEGIAVFVDYVDWYQELLSLEECTGVVPCEFAFGDGIYGHLMDRDPDIRKKSRDMYKLAARISGEIGAVTELEFEYGPQSPLPLFHPYAGTGGTFKRHKRENAPGRNQPLRKSLFKQHQGLQGYSWVPWLKGGRCPGGFLPYVH